MQIKGILETCLYIEAPADRGGPRRVRVRCWRASLHASGQRSNACPMARGKHALKPGLSDT